MVKTVKKSLAALLALAMLMCMAPMALAADVEPQELPTVDYIIENYPKLDDYYGQYIEGYYTYDDFAVGDTLRDAKFYVPADSVFNQPTVFIGVPSGNDPYDFIVDSGWKDLADDKGLYLIMMEDGGDGWGEDVYRVKFEKVERQLKRIKNEAN